MKSINIDKKIMSGVPVLRGHRIPVAQILAEIADGHSIKDISNDMHTVELHELEQLFTDLANEWQVRKYIKHRNDKGE